MKRSLSFCLLLLAFSASAANAYFEETVVGARGRAVGDAAIALVHDASAYYWDPAALGDLKGPEFVVDYMKPYGLDGVDGGAVAFAAKRRGTGLAVAWHHLGLRGAYGEDQFTIAAGRPVLNIRGGGTLAAGIAVRQDRIAFDSFSDPASGATVNYGSQSKLSLDAALRWASPWNIDVAWVGRDLLAPNFEFIGGSGGQTLPSRQALAAAFHWNRESTITLGWSQLDDKRSSVNAGLEILFYNVFAVRSGFSNLSRVYQSLGSPNELQFTGGFGVYHRGYYVDAAATTNHDLGASFHMSVRVPLHSEAR